ncbi:thiamine-phosphate kinase [Luteibacter pinisoli]|uniref:Thiamine-monophosphate kinase n=1 Tax=Luteibacter pinisoli TaxID=2589080 RepID=A0A4Y5Z8R1_9GAMM|nr:thiamine-phosphate kinase [Luteibacter pinisoli]QDE40725.1 thiamine-phosphate kinase [Luteibacter pinisoli]
MEFDLIERIRRHTDVHRDDVVTGIGDDAAVVSIPAGRELAIAVDTLVEGIHFPVGTAAADIGWKALAVNLSDLAAMAATPAWALLALTLPTPDEAFIDGLARGFAELATPFRLALIGGDTTRGPLTVSVTVHGFTTPGQALLRSGARVGDVVMVTGTLGDAAAGLRCLAEADTTPYASLIDRLNRPTPRVAAGQALRGIATACIDVSDGLVADLGHICKQSGVGVEIDPALLPRSSAMLTHFHDADALDFALAGGDDYELCFTVPADRASEVAADLSRVGCGATRIGRVVEGAGVHLVDGTGQVRTPDRAGWNHFA